MKKIKNILFILAIFIICCSQEHERKDENIIFSNNSQFGIDISNHQGKIDWDKVKDWEGHKINFIYIKATEGATYVDKSYQINITQARKRGYLVGSYHYFRTTTSPEKQFEIFVKNVKKDQQDLIPLVDVEEKKNWDDKTFHKNFKKFLELVENHYGKKPLIYTVNSFYNHNLSGKYKDCKFLIGRYGKNSPNMKDNHDWAIWQFSESGKIAGIPKPVDIDALNSNVELKSLLLKDE